MAAEVRKLVLASDYYYNIKQIIGYLCNQYMPLKSYIDSLIVLDLIRKDGKTSSNDFKWA